MIERRQFAPNLIPVRRIGVRKAYLADLYHVLLNRSWLLILASVFVLFALGNAFFALAYFMVGGIENWDGSFTDAFFFSVQTMATIGYGKMAPVSTAAHLIVSIEALTGLTAFAVMTGLVFAKFSRPTARVLFSNVATISVREGVPSLVFRMANERGNQIVEAHLHVALLRDEHTAEGEPVRRVYDLPLARDRSAFFNLTWTAIHPITPQSPLHAATRASLDAVRAVVQVSLTGIDDTFSMTVHARHMYGTDELRWDERLVDLMTRLPDGSLSLDYRRFHDTTPDPPTTRPTRSPADDAPGPGARTDPTVG